MGIEDRAAGRGGHRVVVMLLVISLLLPPRVPAAAAAAVNGRTGAALLTPPVFNPGGPPGGPPGPLETLGDPEPGPTECDACSGSGGLCLAGKAGGAGLSAPPTITQDPVYLSRAIQGQAL